MKFKTLIYNMEKLVPHYKLDTIKFLINNNKYKITAITYFNAKKDFNFNHKDIIEKVKLLKEKDFYKSMTSHNNHTIWQDVYHLSLNSNKQAYIKLQIVDGKSIIIQFKEK